MDSLGLSYWVDGSDESRIPLTSHVYLTVTVRCYRARTCHDYVLVVADAMGLVGALPLMQVASLMVSRVWVSEPGREYRPCS